MPLPTILTLVTFLLGIAAVSYGIFSAEVPEEGAGPIGRKALLWGGSVAVVGDMVAVICCVLGGG